MIRFNTVSHVGVYILLCSKTGIGYSVTLLSMLGAWYYGPIVAWVLLYLWYSFYTVQPWSTCANEWNTDQCVVLRTGDSEVANRTYRNHTDISNTSVANQHGFYPTAATEFWRYANTLSNKTKCTIITQFPFPVYVLVRLFVC